MAKKKRRFRKPAAWLYFPAAFFINIYYRIRYHVKVDRRALRDIKGPALILANHLSNHDHFLVGIALLPKRPTFVLSEHFMSNRFLRPLLGLLHVITKRMFDPDTGTVVNMMRAARSGNIIVLFPEGRLTWIPHSLRITDGTADLIKLLKIDVYRVTPTGAELTFPKWYPGSRPGKIRIETEKLFDASDINGMSRDEIFGILSEELRHDEEDACKGVRFRCRDTANGLDGILYKCPSCGGEWELLIDGCHIRCKCGFDAVLKDDYVFENSPFRTINEWYSWQYSTLNTSCPLECDVIIHTPDSDGNMVRGAGAGHCVLTHDTFTLSGKIFDENLEFSVPSSSVTAVPITVSDHFDIYHDRRLLSISPQPDMRMTVKFAIFFDRLTDERIGLTGK